VAAQGGPTQENFSSNGDDGNSFRREIIRQDIGRRLRRVCADYPAGEFEKLVDQMADRQLKGEKRANRFLD